jgi:hypothetical protein
VSKDGNSPQKPQEEKKATNATESVKSNAEVPPPAQPKPSPKPEVAEGKTPEKPATEGKSPEKPVAAQPPEQKPPSAGVPDQKANASPVKGKPGRSLLNAIR